MVTRNSQTRTPGWDAKLQADLDLVRAATNLAAIRVVAKRYQMQFSTNTTVVAAQNKLTKHIGGLTNTPSPTNGHVDKQTQGSTAAVLSPCSDLRNPLFGESEEEQGSPLPAQRLSYSAALDGRRSMTPLGKVPKSRSPLISSTVAVQEAAPPPKEGVGAATPEMPAAGGGQQHAASSALEQQLLSLQQLVREQNTELAGLRARVSMLESQQRGCHSTALSAVQTTEVLRGDVARLQDQSAHSHKLQEELGFLRSKQEQMAEQQEREECQRAVVLRTPKPLAASDAAAVEGWFSTHVHQPVTVLRVREMGRRTGSTESGSSSGVRDAPTTYKVVLGNSAQRDAVLRAKAKALRGTAYTVDVLLTRQQQANKLGLMPTAKRAAAAGQRVQWRYDRLYIDGKEHRGAGNLPAPRQQKTAVGAKQGEAASAARAILQKGDGWQTVPARKGRARRKQPPKQKPQHQPKQHDGGSGANTARGTPAAARVSPGRADRNGPPSPLGPKPKVGVQPQRNRDCTAGVAQEPVAQCRGSPPSSPGPKAKAGAHAQCTRDSAARGAGKYAAVCRGSSPTSPAAARGAGQHVKHSSSGPGASCSGAEGAASASSLPPSEPRA